MSKLSEIAEIKRIMATWPEPKREPVRAKPPRYPYNDTEHRQRIIDAEAKSVAAELEAQAARYKEPRHAHD